MEGLSYIGLEGINYGDSSKGIYLWLNEFSYISDWDLADINGDGYTDIIAADGPMGGEGLVFIQGMSSSTFDDSLYYASSFYLPPINYSGSQDHHWGDQFTVGDFNGDGRIDLAVAAPYYEQVGLASLNEPGAVFIYLGGYSGLSQTPSVTITGALDYEWLGYGGLVNLGDGNGDGRDDLGILDDYGNLILLWGTSTFPYSYYLEQESPNNLNIKFVVFE